VVLGVTGVAVGLRRRGVGVRVAVLVGFGPPAGVRVGTVWPTDSPPGAAQVALVAPSVSAPRLRIIAAKRRRLRGDRMSFMNAVPLFCQPRTRMSFQARNKSAGSVYLVMAECINDLFR